MGGCSSSFCEIPTSGRGVWPWGHHESCALGGGRLKGVLKSGCNSSYPRLESGFCSRAGGCKTVGGQWGADSSGWGGSDKDY